MVGSCRKSTLSLHPDTIPADTQNLGANQKLSGISRFERLLMLKKIPVGKYWIFRRLKPDEQRRHVDRNLVRGDGGGY